MQYGFVLLVILILQIAAGIFGAVYTTKNKDTIEEKYTDKLSKAIKDYLNDTTAKTAIDDLQKQVSSVVYVVVSIVLILFAFLF